MVPQAELIDPSKYSHHHVTARGRRYHYVDERPTGAPRATLLLIHGFPDLWYGWRYQIKPWAQRGYRIIVPSQVGYATTDKPEDPQCYGFKSVAADMNALLDAIGIAGQVIVVGHDWGGLVAWRLCQYFPQRAKAVVVFCTPYVPPTSPKSTYITHEEMVETRAPFWGYQLFLKSDEGAELLGRNIEGFLGPVFSRRGQQKSSQARHSPDFDFDNSAEAYFTFPGRLREIILLADKARTSGDQLVHKDEKDPERDVYLDTFRKSGIKHALFWYKTWKVNFDDERASGLDRDFPAHIPALFYTAAFDGALPPAMADVVMKGRFPGDLEVRTCEKAGHWLLQDEAYRDRLAAEAADWMDRQLRGPSKL